jgi:hypothetical protein
MKYTKLCIWLLVVIFLVLASGTFFLRWNNERSNQTIITAIDYLEFNRIAMYANRSIDDVLPELKNAGVTTVGLREISMRDMVLWGQILTVPLGEFLMDVQIHDPGLYEAAAKIIGEAGFIGARNTVAISPDISTSAFLYERLSSRFLPHEFLHFSYHNNQYFIMNTELMMTIENRLDVLLGFDETVMQKLTDMGFSLLLIHGPGRGSNDKQWDELESLIERYNVKTLIFSAPVWGGTTQQINRAREVIEKNDIIVGIVEPSFQVGYLNQVGLTPLMASLDFQVNRAYSTQNDDFVSAPRDRYHRWVRGIIDRSIRIMYIRPFGNMRNDTSVILDTTINTIADFTATMEDKGYTFAGTLEPLDTSMSSRANRLALGLSLSAAGVLYLAYLFRLKNNTTLLLWALISAACVAANLIADWTKLYALAATVLYPSLSSLLMLIYLKKYKHHSLMIKMVFATGILLLINALGMYTIVSSLADIRYLMHVEMFTGVKISLNAPFVFFAFNYLMVFKDDDNLFVIIRKFLFKSPNYLILFTGGVGLVLAYISLTRSGNTPTIGPMQLELRLREYLETFFLARPRFREILIGYPALVVMVYFYHRYKASLILFILGFGVVMGSASMTNSFAHTFTSIYISIHRTWAGFLTGMGIAAAVLLGLICIERLFLWWYPRYKHIFTVNQKV